MIEAAVLADSHHPLASSLSMSFFEHEISSSHFPVQGLTLRL